MRVARRRPRAPRSAHTRVVLRVTCVAVAAVTAAFALASAAGGFGSATPSLARLLTRHVPVLVLHPAEEFRPVAVDGFLADSDLTQKTATGWVKIEGPLPSGGADLRLDQRLCRAIDGLAASPCYASAEAAHGSGPIVYGAAFRAKGRIDLQYWLWYPYNDYSPTVPEGEFWQVHEGDWEAVSVVLDAAGKPLAAAYSQHSKGRRRDWARVPRDRGPSSTSPSGRTPTTSPQGPSDSIRAWSSPSSSR